MSAPRGAQRTRILGVRQAGTSPVWWTSRPGTRWVPGVKSRLCGLDVLGAWTLRSLANGEGHLLAFAHRVEWRAGAGRLMEEVLGAVRGGDEAETFVGDALNGAGSWWHACFLLRSRVEVVRCADSAAHSSHAARIVGSLGEMLPGLVGCRNGPSFGPAVL